MRMRKQDNKEMQEMSTTKAHRTVQNRNRQSTRKNSTKADEPGSKKEERDRLNEK